MGAGLGRLCPGPVVWRQVGWPASVRDLWVVQALSAGLHVALKAETTDAAPNLIYLCPKMHVIFHLPLPRGFPCGWGLLSLTLYITFSQQTLLGNLSAEVAVFSTPHIVGNKGMGLMGQTGVCRPSPMNGRERLPECRASAWARRPGAQDIHSTGHLLQGSQHHS